MGWDHEARQARLAPVGEYRPGRYCVTIYDTFEQYKLAMAALVIANGMTVPQFLLYAAEYVFMHHRKLRHFRAVFRKGAREIAAAHRAAGNRQQRADRNENDRREAVERFSRWAGSQLIAEITGEKGRR